MTAFLKHNGDYQINGYTFTNAGLKFPDGTIQSTAGGNSGGDSTSPVSWLDVLNKPLFSAVATSGSYNDLSNKPTILSSFTNDVGYITSASLTWNNIDNKPTLFSGSYTDLTNKPTIFNGSYSDLTNKPTLAQVATTGSYTDLNSLPTLFSGSYNDLTDKPTITISDVSGLQTELNSKATTGKAIAMAIVFGG